MQKVIHRIKNIKQYILLLSLLLCITCFGVTNAYAGVEFSVEVPSDPVLEINIPSNPIVIDVTPTTSAPGFSSNDITVSVGTNNPTGYSLTMETDNTDLTRNPVSAGESTSTISTLADNTGGYTESSFTTNAWGYKFSTGNYYGIPSSLDLLSNTTATNGDSKTITFAAKVDGSKPAGAYETLLKFVAVASYVPGLYTINFEPGDSGSGEMSPQLLNGGQTVPLSANTFTREGYDFSGWLGSDGNTYTDGQSITAPLAGGSLTLTAQWKVGTLYMQNVDTWGSTVTEGTSVQAVDNRDGKKYWVTRLSDGKLWMTQNLDLCIGCANTAALTSENTNLKVVDNGAYSTANGYSQDSSTGVITWTPVRNTIDATNVTNNKIPNWTTDNNTPYSVDPGDWYFTDTWYTNTDRTEYNFLAGTQGNKFSKTPYANNGKHGHVGNYYNWTAAIATNNSSSLSSSTLSNITNNPKNSICPKGWRLPTIYGGSSTNDARNEFYTLNRLYNSSSTSTSKGLEASPVYFVRGGNVAGSVNYSGYVGTYWSSTVGNSIITYLLYFNSSYVNPANSSNCHYGYSVRCVAE